MFAAHRQLGMTLAEVLVTLAIVLILVGVMSGVGVYLKKQSEIRLVESTLEVLGTALGQYYSDYGAYVPPVTSKEEFKTAVCGSEGTVTFVQGEHLQGEAEKAAWSSEALYYFLNRSPAAAAIVSSLMERMISSKDASGKPLVVEITCSSTESVRTNLVRFVDVWGMPIGYMLVENQLPVLISAGPDKKFDTADDIIHR
ncbi:MAG TPA: type II secretion system protein [Anaerohalosphaeraceae bacterium]|nr:type II secretion system protein [Anaerohalosphaeraceae bacterium]HPB92624.1 type II secretion system protein [Anaerohalosphaeraceae bacterium]HRT24045.1 type II secretion system protein [Anaerohalosphaeraceae bacterium]